MSDCHAGGTATLAAPPPATSLKPASRRIVAVVGPPNSGKSTLFNRLTGLRQKVANYPGVTVEKRLGRAKLSNGKEVLLVDLPGVYSLSPRSEDERITRDVLTGQREDVPRPDAIILILDSTNLGRHLTLAAPILSLGLPTLVALNMADDLKSRGGGLDTDSLSKEIGAPVALISARGGQGIDQVVGFLGGRPSPPARVELPAVSLPVVSLPVISLPVISDVPRCRDWAAQVSARSRGRCNGHHQSRGNTSGVGRFVRSRHQRRWTLRHIRQSGRQLYVR